MAAGAGDPVKNRPDLGHLIDLFEVGLTRGENLQVVWVVHDGAERRSETT